MEPLLSVKSKDMDHACKQALRELLASLTPEDRMDGLSPEELLQELSPEQLEGLRQLLLIHTKDDDSPRPK